MPQLVTFTFGGPPHRCPVCVAVGGQVVATVGADFLPQATINEHARCLGEVNDISYVDGKWRFIVEFADGIFSENIIARDVLDGSLSPVSPTDDWLMRKVSEFDDLAAVAFSGAYAHLSGKPTLASQAEAEAGDENTKTMTPLRVAQAIDALCFNNLYDSRQVTTDGAGTSEIAVAMQLEPSRRYLITVMIDAWDLSTDGSVLNIYGENETGIEKITGIWEASWVQTASQPLGPFLFDPNTSNQFTLQDTQVPIFVRGQFIVETEDSGPNAFNVNIEDDGSHELQANITAIAQDLGAYSL